MKKRCIIVISKNNIFTKQIISYLKRRFVAKIIWSTNKRNEDLTNKFDNWKGHYLFHYASYYKIPKKILNKANIYKINFHPAPSKYPGSGGASMAIYNNDKYFGSVAHFINSKIDNGLIIKETKFKISKNETLETIKNKSIKDQFFLFKYIVDKIYKEKKSELLNASKYKKINWSKKLYKIKDIDKLQSFNLKVSKNNIEEINKIIRATHLKKFPVSIKIHNKKFIYSNE